MIKLKQVSMQDFLRRVDEFDSHTPMFERYSEAMNKKANKKMQPSERQYIECACHSDEHIIKFTHDREENEIYTSVQLRQWNNVFKRMWIAVKYVFGYDCKYGHWDSTIIWEKEAIKLRDMCERLIAQEIQFKRQGCRCYKQPCGCVDQYIVQAVATKSILSRATTFQKALSDAISFSNWNHECQVLDKQGNVLKHLQPYSKKK